MEEKKKIKVTMLQMSAVIGDVEANCKKVEDILNNNLKEQTDVLVLPEVWTVGWSCSHFQETAQDLNDSSVIRFLSRIAKEYNINIIGGSFITKLEGKYYNTCPVIDRNGKLLTTYSKNHLYSYYGCNEGKFITTGNSPVVAEGIRTSGPFCGDGRQLVK